MGKSCDSTRWSIVGDVPGRDGHTGRTSLYINMVGSPHLIMLIECFQSIDVPILSGPLFQFQTKLCHHTTHIESRSKIFLIIIQKS